MNTSDNVVVPLLQASHLSKNFGETRALRDCSLKLYPGEIHALMGENGSGKSTLVKILGGVHKPSGGTMLHNGVASDAFANPSQSQRFGVAVVYQEIVTVTTQSILENVWLGGEGLFSGRVRKSEKRRRAREVLGRLLGRDVDVDASISSLSLSDRQACGIARALLREPRILVLDEATSALDVATRDRLFAIATEMSAAGASVVLITHRMDEVEQIGDRITVMRSGTTVGELARGHWTPETMVAMMTGADRLTAHVRDDGPRAAATGEAVLTVRDLQLAPGHSTSIDIQAGQLIGLAGLEGQGQDEFLRSLAGLGSAPGDVRRVHGHGSAAISSLRDAAKNGIAYLPRERGAESAFSWMSILENFALPTLGKDRVGLFVSSQRTRMRFQDYVESLRIKLGSDQDAITTLSGGNQQKVFIARWLATGPSVLLLNDPTRGIDINAKRDLYRLLTELTAAGTTVVMLSTEVDELVELMDRVLVFRENQLHEVIERDNLSSEALVASYFGRSTTNV